MSGELNPWMHKQGAIRKNWKKRYFVLAPEQIAYFTGEGKGRSFDEKVKSGQAADGTRFGAQGVISLQDASVWLGHPVASEMAYSSVQGALNNSYFEIVGPHRRFRLLARSEDARQAWAVAAMEAVERNEPWHGQVADYLDKRHEVLEGLLYCKGTAAPAGAAAGSAAATDYVEKDVVVTFFHLVVFKNFDENESEDVIDLRTCEMGAIKPESVEFEVRDGGRTVSFRATDSASLKRWSEFVDNQIRVAKSVSGRGGASGSGSRP